MEEKEDNENFEKIKVLSSEDEKLKILGELLSNKSSRDIIRLLIEKEMYTNEIAKKLELSRNLVSHHLQKMRSIGLLKITNKKIIRKGMDHRFFKIESFIFLAPTQTNEELKEKGSLKRIFKDTVKIMGIAISGLISWIIFNALFSLNKTVTDNNEDTERLEGIDIAYADNSTDILISVTLAIMIMSVLTALLFMKKIKNRD